ncbi:cob(I)yrinic acid a,c-diamide adenosyltransferase [Anaerospora hongkongensis]|uniref:cob(I)yrinic acid a,c-diamide adenosyltransferase n=1 Tax=Anaerospora hongkongensis TaxID=244830 RepID=UPI00289A21C8|nr:cob(I)yrinic acid a,c-diamide adenosyltransferase [Anaerospora hongkongensis]
MKVYTKTGDKGQTGLYTGERVDKDSVRVEAYGMVDEADSALGMARAIAVNPEVKTTIYDLQKLLWSLMADVASVGAEPRITGKEVQQLEALIDKFDAELPPLTSFLVPGDTASSAALDIARTVTRRAERQLWRLSRQEELSGEGLVFLNRLSDLCFVLARVEINGK